jgi:hypothetical protein
MMRDLAYDDLADGNRQLPDQLRGRFVSGPRAWKHPRGTP